MSPPVRWLVAALVLGLVPGLSWGQGIDRVSLRPYEVVYRPDTVSYRVHPGERFDLIYQTGARDMAERTAGALRRSWPGTDSLVGPVADDVHMPVVINNFNDRSNGIVDPTPFRQEIEAPSIKADRLMAHAPSWPALVGPHEGVHVAHAEVARGVGIGGLVRPFAPDVARGLNFAAPAGLIEGVAVYRESQLAPNTGRLHSPLFTMKMKAALLSDDPWSLTQMLEPPSYTQPSNRFYIGGAHLFEYLAERGGSTDTSFFGEMVGTHNRIPFLGFGPWLRRATGQWPTSLRDSVRTALRDTFRAEQARRAPFTPTTTVAGAEGLNHRRPYWVSDSTLVAYVFGYNVRPGFYRIDAATGERTPLRTQSITEDYTYSLGPDTTALYASRYVPSPTVPRQSIAEVERIALSDGRTTRMTERGRAFAPARSNNGPLYAATNDGPFTRWSVVTDAGSTRALTPPAPSRVRQVAPSPTDDRVAVLVHDGTTQRLYRAAEPVTAPATLRPWIGLAGGTIYDVSWGPDGRYLVFAAEQGPAADVYAYDTRSRDLLRLATVRYGALEPALSPDRSRVAFVRYRHERHDLVRMPFRPDSATVVPDSLVWRGDESRGYATDRRSARPTFDSDSTRPYAAGRHLAPRMVYPTLRVPETENETVTTTEPGTPYGVGVGLAVAGSDPLQRWAYTGEAFWQAGRLWGEAKVQTGRWLLRPSVSVYDRPFPATVRLRRGNQLGTARVGVEERGANLGLRLPLTLRSNVYQSVLRFRLDTEWRETRFFGGPLDAPTPFTSRVTLSPRMVFGYRLQQNTRDVVPNTGVVVGVLGEFDAWTEQGPGTAAVLGLVDAYLPVLRRTNTGVRLGLRGLTQEAGSVADLSSIPPRGYDALALPGTNYLQFEAEVTQPLAYIDDGLTTVPFYAEVLSAYGFGETLGRVRGTDWTETASSVGAGLSLQGRFFYGLGVDLRLGIAVRPGRDDSVWIGR